MQCGPLEHTLHQPLVSCDLNNPTRSPFGARGAALFCKLKVLVLPLRILLVFLFRVYKSGLNERNVFTLALNFGLNFAPVAVWLAIFKNAGRIPHSWRPAIHVPLVMTMDDFVFNPLSLNAWLSCGIIMACSYPLYVLFYQKKQPQAELDIEQASFTLEMDAFSDSSLENEDLYKGAAEEVTSIRTSSLTEGIILSEPLAKTTIFTKVTASTPLNPITEVSARSDHRGSSNSPGAFGANHVLLHCLTLDATPNVPSSSPYPKGCMLMAPPVLLCASWAMLNVDHWWATNSLSTPKDLFAWFLYVLLHLLMPIFTSIWLYVFHAPGALQTFSWCLGIQNIAGVLTHLVFPNAPPWFIHMYGADKIADYDIPGYAAGLTRVDIAMGTNIHSKGFHKSPIVFGAFPSLHSAMAVMCCFFICYHARSAIPKFAFGWMYVLVQWWATIYLEHHWRVDLVCGLLYSIVSFTLFKHRLVKHQREFVQARREGDEARGFTMGMRVFKNTKLQHWFDPL